MNALTVLQRSKNSRILAMTAKGFDWNAVLSAPFGTQGWFMFRTPHPDTHKAVERTMEMERARLLQQFAATFSVLAVGTNLTAYTNAVSQILLDDGIEEGAYFPRLALPLIVTGLSNWAIITGTYLHLIREEAMVKLPISPMHIWALGEASRIHLSCISNQENWVETQADAENVLNITHTENIAIHDTEEPYRNIYLEDYDDRVGAIVQGVKNV